MIGCDVLVGPESHDVNRGRIARHRSELLPGDESTSPAQRNQLCDSVTITRDGKGLAMLDRVHDLSGSVAQITLSDLRLAGHKATLPECAT
jgi:hypothetical protein